MLDYLIHAIARPSIALWLATSEHSWKRRVVAHDSPHLQAPDTDFDSLLIVGDGAAAGRGVSTHQLGLPGYLARSLGRRSGRSADVEIDVDDEMGVLKCLDALVARDLAPYDIVVISTGAGDALSLVPATEWQLEMRALLTAARLQTPRETKIFVLAIPLFGRNPHFPRALANTVDHHVGVLNTITEQLAAEQKNVVFVAETRYQILEGAGADDYEQWAESIADRIVQNLDPRRPHRGDSGESYEEARVQAVEHLESLGTATDGVVDRLTHEARQRFQVDAAAMTLVGSEVEHVHGASGIDHGDFARDDAICDITIRGRGLHVIEDAQSDYRFADYSVVKGQMGVRFYAGYPIESPDGYRVGALCLLDGKTRRFSPVDAADLRGLALRVQQHLYSAEDAAVC